MNRLRIAILASVLICSSAALIRAAPEGQQRIGINIVLDRPATDAILADLGTHGTVLDVMPEINGVTMRAAESELAAIRALAYVAGASPDEPYWPAGVTVPDFSDGANHWTLDAVDVTDASGGRAVDYDGDGVFVAVIDSGLPYNWREYFPEGRIDALHARTFGGGGGDLGTVSAQPQRWEQDTAGHGAKVAGIILGFRYAGPEPGFPASFNGVAPKATVIPIKIRQENDFAWASVLARGIVYATELKKSGALGDAPLVANLSIEGYGSDVLVPAAVEYALENGVVLVAAAGNRGAVGMGFPGRHPGVISAGMTGFVGQFPEGDSSRNAWILDDVAEDDPEEHYVPLFSARELPGQDLDVLAPGYLVPVPYTQDGRVDYTFEGGTSFAAPHVAGLAALMLQKNPALTATEIEQILEGTAMPLAPSCRDFRDALPGRPGRPPNWSDDRSLVFFDNRACWGADATGAGLVQAVATLAATPLP